MARSGRFAAITNFRDLEASPAPGSPSRGALVPRFLASRGDAEAFLGDLRDEAAGFAGFNLLVAGADSLHYYSNRVETGPCELAPGIYGLSNHRLDSPWPKLVRARQAFAGLLESREVEVDSLFDLLADREPAPRAATSESGPAAELELALSAPFVRHPRYGTRCSTVILAGTAGRTVVHERRFDAAGGQTGATRLAFDRPGAT